jgi:hypothetical protein
VYAIGDVTAVRLLNGTLLPKAGVFAESEARVVAQAIAADISGQKRVAGWMCRYRAVRQRPKIKKLDVARSPFTEEFLVVARCGALPRTRTGVGELEAQALAGTGADGTTTGKGHASPTTSPAETNQPRCESALTARLSPSTK